LPPPRSVNALRSRPAHTATAGAHVANCCKGGSGGGGGKGAEQQLPVWLRAQQPRLLSLTWYCRLAATQVCTSAGLAACTQV
jgi:hypothetical protein